MDCVCAAAAAAVAPAAADVAPADATTPVWWRPACPELYSHRRYCLSETALNYAC